MGGGRIYGWGEEGEENGDGWEGGDMEGVCIGKSGWMDRRGSEILVG